MTKRTYAHRILTAVAFAICLLISVVILCSCNKFNDTNYSKDPDYIEVESLRFNTGNANVFMSSYGEPSTYQLDIKTVPSNATNQKLIYYIPSDYHQYVTVDENGLLSAHKISGDTLINLIVRSTTNEKASLTVTIKVEDVEVNELRFVQERIPLLYNGESEQIKVIFEPYHAIIGRDLLTFTSSDEKICTVEKDGTVKPVGAGYTAVKAACRISTTKTVSKHIEVQVSYAKGQYQLDVSGNPDFNQVVGHYSPIDFTLLLLGENVDPHPQITWYVDTERVPTNDDRTQYTHTPSATTQITYYVYAYVKPYQGELITLRSAPITVYQAFNGIDLVYDNISSLYTGYKYGDTVTFDIGMGDSSSTIAKYSWELAEISRPYDTVVIAETYPDDRNLTRRINVAGDYALTAIGLDSKGNKVRQSMFTFSSEKFVEGDTLVARPKLLKYGLPPDSYHWYIVPCDADGNYDPTEKELFTDTPTNVPLYYPLTEGNYRLIVTASIGGVTATVKENGSDVPYEYVSDVIRVYPPYYEDANTGNNLIDPHNAAQRKFSTKNYAAIDSVRIEGIGREEKQVFIKWNNVEHTPSFIVEITFTDGSVIIQDSMDKSSGNTFGSNFVYLSRDLVTLKDAFTVRIKQKNGLYSVPYSYGIPNDKGVGDETHILTFDGFVEPFFSTIGYNNASTEYIPSLASTMNSPAINAYISDMDDLRDLIAFVLLFTPSANSYIEKGSVTVEEELFDTYSFDIYVPFMPTDAEKAKYPHGLTEEELASYGSHDVLASMIHGVAATLPFGFNFDLLLQDADVGTNVTFLLPAARGSEIKSTLATAAQATDSEYFTVDKSETVDSSNLPIDNKESFSVRSSDELVYAVEKGYKPTPWGSDALSDLYKRIKDITVRVFDPYATDLETALAFANYLALRVTIDDKIGEIASGDIDDHSLYLFRPYRLEGVFGSWIANDVGIAKAYVVMCGIVGIPCHTAKVKVDGVCRTINKVRIDGVWYIVDIPYGMRVIEGYSVTAQDTILISDAEYIMLLGKASILGCSHTALGTTGKAHPGISSDNDLRSFFTSVPATHDAGVYGLELVFSKTEYVDEDAIGEALAALNVGKVKIEGFTVINSDNNTTMVIVLTTVII